LTAAAEIAGKAIDKAIGKAILDALAGVARRSASVARIAEALSPLRACRAARTVMIAVVVPEKRGDERS
jgi:hypothetical protein